MTCKDFVDLLADYLDTTLGPEVVAELDAHLEDCPACRAYLRTYRRTSALVRDVQRAEAPPDMPDDVKARLRAFLRARLARPR